MLESDLVLMPRAWPRELARILFRRRWLLSAVIVFGIAAPALQPAQAWIAKSVLDRLTTRGVSFDRQELLSFFPLVIGVFALLGGIQFVRHALDKILDAQLKIDFQRFYFDHHRCGSAAEDVSRTFNDCEQARKMVDILQTDIWVVAIGLPAVLVWQLRLAREWVVPLLVTTLPALALVVFLGPLVGRWSRRRLEALARISGAVCASDRSGLHAGQAVFFRSSVCFEVYKKAAEVLGELVLWLGLAVLLLGSAFLPLLPEQISAGELASFLVNVNLLRKPLQEAGKMYVKIHESYPGVLRVFASPVEFTGQPLTATGDPAP
jgi:hypothetical protein